MMGRTASVEARCAGALLRSLILRVALFLMALGFAGRARADASDILVQEESHSSGVEDVAVLYTISPGASVLERYGHCLLCLESLTKADCFDFGVFSEGSAGEVVRGSLLGKAMFVPQHAPGMKLIKGYESLDRSIQRQVLPLTPSEVGKLRDRLDQAVHQQEAYAYHPTRRNCSTKIRDLLNDVSGGALRLDRAEKRELTYRQLTEVGFSGRPLLLMGTALFVGSAADEPTTMWDRAFLPSSLRELVTSSWGVPAQEVYVQSWTRLPTSVHAGRGLLIFLGMLLAVSIILSGRRSERLYLATMSMSGLVLGLIGLVGWGLRLLSPFPEFATNWVPLMAFPMDVGVGFLPRKWRLRYVAGRITVSFLLIVASQMGVIAQPLLWVGVFVMLPLAAIVWTEQGRRRSRRNPQSQSRLSVQRLREVAGVS